MSNPPTSITIVIKVGTSSICDEQTQHPRLSNLSALVETVVHLRSLGHRVVLVSSGAIGMGMRTLGLPKRPKHLAQKQALAAVGQGRLMSMYDQLFSHFHQPIAQVLLTRHDIADEIRFGDNDSLSAITAGMLNANWLFLLTDVDCLYTDNPRTNPDAKPLRRIEDIEQQMKDGSALGTGGMVTKIIAANLATAAGVHTAILSGTRGRQIIDIVTKESNQLPDDILFTHFVAKTNPMVDRKWWILHSLYAHGTLLVDEGAFKAMANHSASLFAAGVVGVEGDFNDQEAVRIVLAKQDTEKNVIVRVEIGKGIVNYTSSEVERVKGLHSHDIARILGYQDAECIVHRDNLVITKAPAEVHQE